MKILLLIGTIYYIICLGVVIHAYRNSMDANHLDID